MLKAAHLTHMYGRRTVLDIADFELPAGSVTAVVGPNGSGKSTLLRILGLVERPRTGDVTLEDRPIVSAADSRWARRRVTLVEQSPYLFRGTVQQNVRYALSLHGIRGAEAQRRTTEALERLHLGAFADRSAGELSAGEIQRVAVARAIALRPMVLLMDEPVGVADRAAAAQLLRILQNERARGAAICFASHQLEDAFRWSDHLTALAEGRSSPITPENLFRAVLPEGSGAKQAAIGPLHVEVVTDKSGAVTIAIPPEEVLVSLHPLDSSARNEYIGSVIRISERGPDEVTVTVDVGVDIAARITRGSLERLGIHVGTRVVLAIKALAVRVF